MVFEGVDGAGKSTLMKGLSQELERRGQNFVVTREPGGTPLAEKIRAESSEIQLPEDLRQLPLELSFGLAEWEQGDDPRTLTERAMLITDATSGSHRAAPNRH